MVDVPGGVTMGGGGLVTVEEAEPQPEKNSAHRMRIAKGVAGAQR